MNKHVLAVAVGTALLGTGAASAAPFNSFDPRSIAMGGVGVAMGNAATAPFFNPAALSVTDAGDDFTADFPIVGGRIYDPDGLVTGIQDFKDEDLLTKLQNATNNTDRKTYTDLLLTDDDVGFAAVANKPLMGEFGAGIVIGIPSKQYGAAFVASSWASGGGVGTYTEHDQQALQAISTACGNDDPSCATLVSDFNSDSTVDIRGVSLTEIGVSLSREFNMQGMPIALGITPKYVGVITFDYSSAVNEADTGDMQASDYIYETSSFNIDVGAARDFGNGWRAGAVIKNLIPQEYDLVQNGVTQEDTVKLNPQARVGASYEQGWFTVGADLDLTENEAVGFEDNTRYLALGAEMNAADWAQLRVGYRADLVNSDRSVVSAGFGLSPFGMHFDLGVAANSSELGAAAQLGFRF